MSELVIADSLIHCYTIFFFNLTLIFVRKDMYYMCRASKTFILFVQSTEAETGYFGGQQAVKGEESQCSLTEALCLFCVPPWGLHLSPVTNIHIIDRVLYSRMAFLSPIIENWLWQWYRGIKKNTFQANCVFFFFRYFPLILCINLFYNMYEMYKSIYVEIMIILFCKK